MRLFVSVDLDALADEIAAVQDLFAGADGLRFTDPSQAHVTLQFLGETPSDRVPDLCAALDRAVADSDVPPFRVELGGLGVFPSIEYITVVWLGVREGGAALTRLHEGVEAATTDLGFDPADHEFEPHVTLARMDHAGDKDRVQRLVRNRDPAAGALSVESVALTESTRTPDGPVYETVERFDLDG